MQDIKDLFVPSVSQTIREAVLHRNFKNGAFRNLIHENTSALEGVDILLASPCLSASEKAKTRLVREALIDYEKTKWVNISNTEVVMKTACTYEWCDIFAEDMRKSGKYVPPMMVQSIDSGGNVSSTTTIDDNGNGHSIRGGKIGEVPGAPEGFNYANMKHAADIGLDPKGTKGSQGASRAQA